jgi:integrase
MARQVGDKVSAYGTGSLSETAPSSGVWRYRYRADGRQVRATFGSKAEPLSRKQAERRVRNLDPTTPAPVVKDGRMVGDVLTEWLDYGRTTQGKQWAPRTADDNRKQVESRIRPALGDIRLADLTAAKLENVYTSWSADGLSDNSMHRYAALISSALSFAVRRDYIEASPATKAVAPAATKSTKRIPTAKEVAKLLRAAEEFGKDMAAAIAIAVLTGARAGEVAALRWRDINLKRGTILIDKSATEVDGVVTIKGTKTGDERIARVENGNLAVLREKIGKPGDPDAFVIDGGTEPINPGIISDRFVKVRSLAHVRNIGFHSLRKYYVTSLLSAGVPDHAVALTVGWKSTRMIDTYAGATKSGFDAAAAVELLPAQ